MDQLDEWKEEGAVPFADGAPVLLEPSLADAMAAIAADALLSNQIKTGWLTSLRRIAAGIGRPPESLPARITALRHPVRRLHAGVMGVTEKTLANHRSNLKSALQHYLQIEGVPRRGTPLTVEWQVLLNRIADVRPRRLLCGFARFCSAQGIAPAEVTAESVETYFAYRSTATFLADGIAARRSLIRAWNAASETVPGWSAIHFEVPDLPSQSPGPAWAEFPEGLRRDLEAYLALLAKPHRSANGKRRRPCRASTVATRRTELVAFVRRAVAVGIPLCQLSSLEALLAPDIVRPVFEAYLGPEDSRPRHYVIDLAWKLLSIARMIGAPAETVANLDEIWAVLEEDRGPKLTEKNLAVIRAVLSTDIWQRVVSLPLRLMEKAERLRARSPRKAAALAALAVQIAILTRAPIRTGNLMRIKLGTNLIRPGGRKGAYHLVFPEFDVKNRIDLNFVLSPAVTELIDTYIRDFRPRLGGNQRSDWLFPGEDGKPRGRAHASAAIARAVEKETGLRVTGHQFRHAAAAIILKTHPGNFEFVRRVLGHRNVQTTIMFYTALEGFSATEHFAAIIEPSVGGPKQGPSSRRRP